MKAKHRTGTPVKEIQERLQLEREIKSGKRSDYVLVQR